MRVMYTVHFPRVSVSVCVRVPAVSMFTSALLAVDNTPESPAAVQPLQMRLSSLSN